MTTGSTNAVSIAFKSIELAQQKLKMAANNIANADTTAYKSEYLTTQDVGFYDYLKQSGYKNDDQTASPAGLYVGNGATHVSTLRNLSQGELVSTGSKLDFALSGAGYIAVNYKDKKVFTRNTSMMLGKNRKLQIQGGHELNDDITIPEGISEETLDISSSGEVTVRDGERNKIVIGQISVYNFNNEQGLMHASGVHGGLLDQTEASGEAIQNIPGENGSSMIAHTFLEKANVDSHQEIMNIMSASRSMQYCWQIITMLYKAEASSMESMRAASTA
jgi:flagellar basal-body rod protein FlgG